MNYDNYFSKGTTASGSWFIVVSGYGLIQDRNLNTIEVMEFEVSDEKIETA